MQQAFIMIAKIKGFRLVQIGKLVAALLILQIALSQNASGFYAVIPTSSNVGGGAVSGSFQVIKAGVQQDTIFAQVDVNSPWLTVDSITQGTFGVVFFSCAANNTASGRQGTITISMNGEPNKDYTVNQAPGLPDLIIESITHTPQPATLNQATTITVRVKNTGQTHTGTFSVAYWKDRPTSPTISDVPDGALTITDINGGESKDVRFNASMPASGNFKTWAYVDQANGVGDVAEGDETNNFGGPALWRVLPNQQLNVNAWGANGVVITGLSNANHGGTTSYTLTLPQHTLITLKAPATAGSGPTAKNFYRWSGIPYTGRIITFHLASDTKPVANYVSPNTTSQTLRVYVAGTGGATVNIKSNSGDGGQADYIKTLPRSIIVNLQAPMFIGTGPSLKIFNGWTGSITYNKPGITMTMGTDHTVTANYVSGP